MLVQIIHRRPTKNFFHHKRNNSSKSLLVQNEKTGIFVISYRLCYLKIFLLSFRENGTIRSTVIDCRDTMVPAWRVSRATRRKRKENRFVVIGSVTKVGFHKSRPRVEKRRLVTDVTWSLIKRNQGQPFPFHIVIRIDPDCCYIFRLAKLSSGIYDDRRDDI